MNTTTKKITFTAVGIALYVVLSMIMKIPLISHISLDLGYLVFAIYCYHFGAWMGAIVGGFGCVLISLLTTGWFPIGWFVGNLVIGLICGLGYHHSTEKKHIIYDMILTIAAVSLGVFCIKTIIECALYGIPLVVKMPKNAIAFATDAAVMCCGRLLAMYKPIASMVEIK